MDLEIAPCEDKMVKMTVLMGIAVIVIVMISWVRVKVNQYNYSTANILLCHLRGTLASTVYSGCIVSHSQAQATVYAKKARLVLIGVQEGTFKTKQPSTIPSFWPHRLEVILSQPPVFQLGRSDVSAIWLVCSGYYQVPHSLSTNQKTAPPSPQFEIVITNVRALHRIFRFGRSPMASILFKALNFLTYVSVPKTSA